jgi:hypothetical protein
VRILDSVFDVVPVEESTNISPSDAAIEFKEYRDYASCVFAVLRIEIAAFE